MTEAASSRHLSLMSSSKNISSIVVIDGRKKRLFLGREDNARNRDGAIFVMSRAFVEKKRPDEGGKERDRLGWHTQQDKLHTNDVSNEISIIFDLEYFATVLFSLKKYVLC